MTETHTLEDLSKKVIHLSGNDLINKKLSGNGAGSVFNVCHEILSVYSRSFNQRKIQLMDALIACTYGHLFCLEFTTKEPGGKPMSEK